MVMVDMVTEVPNELVGLISSTRLGLGSDEYKKKEEKIDQNNLVLETIIVHTKCGVDCPRALIVERWNIKVESNLTIQGLAPVFLKNAIRSHLHFSQLNSWISSNGGKLPKNFICSYRIINMKDLKPLGDSDVEIHSFPVCRLDSERIVKVSVSYLRKAEIPLPIGLCLNLRLVTSDEWIESPPSSPEEIVLPNDHGRLKHKPLPAPILSPDGPAPKIPAFEANISKNRVACRRLFEDETSDLKQPKVDEQKKESNVAEQLMKVRLQNITEARGRQRARSGGILTFNKITGLPLHSSPAPLGRQRNFSSSDATDAENEPRLCRSSPNGSLLGSFEESALNGRLDAVQQLDGFSMQMTASGSFISPHVTLPVRTYFFDLDSQTPTPYLGVCPLDSVGRKGYRIPKVGCIQATLFNPQSTVVKMFLIPYDMSDMPASSQTFMRHRTNMTNGAKDEEKHLIHLMHLRMATDSRGRLYIHTDIRMLFSQNGSLDGLNLDVKNGGRAVDVEKWKLTSETEMPSQPKYSSSPKKHV